MVARILLSENSWRESHPSSYQTLDQAYETGLAPSPEGHCVKAGCNGQIYRWFGKQTHTIFVPGCILCGARYKMTPPELFLPLLGIDDA